VASGGTTSSLRTISWISRIWSGGANHDQAVGAARRELLCNPSKGRRRKSRRHLRPHHLGIAAGARCSHLGCHELIDFGRQLAGNASLSGMTTIDACSPRTSSSPIIWTRRWTL